MKHFIKILTDNYNNLATETYCLALRRGLILNSSTSVDTFIAPILTVNEALENTCDCYSSSVDICLDTKFLDKLINFYCIARQQKVTMLEKCDIFLDIIKCFRHSYRTQLSKLSSDPALLSAHNFLELFFDELERSLCSNWINIELNLRKQKELELLQSEERLRTLINAMPDFICFKDGTGRWEEANEVLINLLNLDANSYKGKTNQEIASENVFFEPVLKACEATDIMAWDMKRIIINEEIFPSMDGNKKIFDVIKVPLFYSNGERKGLVEIGRDITNRKKVEERLLESEERYRRLIEFLPDSIFIVSQGKIAFANKEGVKLLGQDTLEDCFGKRLEDFLIPSIDSIKKQEDDFKNLVIKGNLPLSEQKFIRCSDKKIIFLESAITLFPYNEKNSLLYVCRNIDERKKTEELRNKIEENTKLLNEALAYDKLKTEFFSNISHEIRTPLNIILSTLQMIDLLRNNDTIAYDKYKLNNYLSSMKQNSLRLLKLVNNLIDITKIDSGYLYVNLQPCNIVKVVEDISLSTSGYIHNKGIELIFDTDFEEKILNIDIDKIERIMLNLLSNAVKFTKPNGNIMVKLYENKNHVYISVKDSGIGIPKEKQQLIFERFIQVDKSLTRNHEGSGIGLSIVKSLVEMHNGKIFLNSEYGKGSEFIIELPIPKDLEIINTMGDNLFIKQTNEDLVNMEFSDIYT